ncbi:hypothetical protein N8149_00220 [Gammaproteobacteria bacterium]|nr:hypothetical protein [Gammaproteobacteria bacterium]
MKNKLLIITFIFCLTNYSYSEQEINKQSIDIEKLMEISITYNAATKIIEPLSRCTNLYTGIYGHMSTYPESIFSDLDPVKYLHGSRDLLLEIGKFAASIGREDLIQSIDEAVELSVYYRNTLDNAYQYNSQEARETISIELQTCIGLVKFFASFDIES